MAEQLKISRLTYIAIESGEKKPTIEQIDKISTAFGISSFALLFPETSTEDETNKVARYRQMCLACIHFGGAASDGKITKTKLAKLLYLVDFAWYKNTGEPMSGLQYRALPRGPVADAFFRMIDEMFETGQILLETKGAAIMISANENSLASSLTTQELSVIESVCTKWRLSDTQSLVELSHRQAPWRSAQIGALIPYELAEKIPDEELF